MREYTSPDANASPEGLRAFLVPEVPEHIRHDVRIKSYPDGTFDVLVADRAIFRAPGWEARPDPEGERARAWEEFWAQADPMPEVELSSYHLARREAAEQQRAADNLDRAQRRAKVALRGLALSNDFRYFVTLTLDASRVDRHDVKAITRKLNNWLDNQVRRSGLRYVLVPERHKDGAIHFHGFFNDALSVVDSGTVIPPEGGRPRKPRSAAQRRLWLQGGGHVVYNLPAWSLGFTTAIELYGSKRAAVAYVCKYISKQQHDGGKIGGRWYYSGGDLRRPTVTLADASQCDFSTLTPAGEFTVDALGVKVVRYSSEGGDGL